MRRRHAVPTGCEQIPSQLFSRAIEFQLEGNSQGVSKDTALGHFFLDQASVQRHCGEHFSNPRPGVSLAIGILAHRTLVP